MRFNKWKSLIFRRFSSLYTLHRADRPHFYEIPVIECCVGCQLRVTMILIEDWTHNWSENCHCCAPCPLVHKSKTTWTTTYNQLKWVKVCAWSKSNMDATNTYVIDVTANTGLTILTIQGQYENCVVNKYHNVPEEAPSTIENVRKKNSIPMLDQKKS